ncbi:MAG: LacI family transcriptional regulator [Bacteroides sp.]|nr:LacI family transcriptional regulator [Bacteroides sp.]
MKHTTTLADIAKKLNLSIPTVSRALRGDDLNISEKTKKRVLRTAKRMGYKRNEMAANLRKNCTRTVGIIVPEAVNFFFMKFIFHAQEYLQKEGYRVTLAQCSENADTERINLQMMIDYRVDGVIICACHNTKNMDAYKELLDRGIPLVFFDRTVDGIPVSKVKIDDYMKAFFMVEHLIRQGKRRIVHLSGPDFIQNSHERIRAYKDALKKFKIPFEHIVESGVSFEDGEKAMEALIHSGLQFDAVFCFTENAALGAKHVLQRHHVEIPQNVAICCVSGTQLSTLVYPKMTAIEQPVQLMAKKSVELMLEKLNNPNAKEQEVFLKAMMIVRESTDNQLDRNNGY